jgi:hypothetical protein
MAGNRIYRGPQDRQPKTRTGKTVGALLPGTFVTEGASAFTQATAPGPMLRLLGARDFYDAGQLTNANPLTTAYTADDTAQAFVIEPGQLYNAAVANATYAYGQELTVAASGRLAAAAQGNIVVAYSLETGARTAGALIDVEIANFYTKP